MDKTIKIILFLIGIFANFYTFGITNIKVNPIRLILSPENSVATLRLTNLTDKAASFQTSEKFCTLVHDKSVCQVNNQFIVSPPIFTLIPHKEQIIRIGLPSTHSVSTEKLYRLYLRQIPPKHIEIIEGSSTIKTLLHISIPIYLVPKAVDHHSYFKAKMAENHKLILYFENHGNVHEYTKMLSISSKQHPTPKYQKFTHYIFPNQNRDLVVTLPEEYWHDKNLHIELATQYKNYQTNVI